MDKKEKTAKTAEQNAQARLVLIQLLWIFVILLITAMVWLYSNQKKLALHLEERLLVIQSFDGRMNDMDDRIFAMTTMPEKAGNERSTQNDVQLTEVQLDVVDRLYRQGNYADAFEMLKILQEQLRTDELSLAVPLKSSLASAISEDLASLEVLQKTIDPWQAQVIRLQEIQSYLRHIEKDLPKGESLSRKELGVRDAMMSLSLAIGATTLKDRATMVGYMNDCLYHLKHLDELGVGNVSDTKSTDKPATQEHSKDNDKTAKETTTPTANTEQIDTLERAIFAVNHLLANPPSLPSLKSVMLFKTPKTAVARVSE